jgi:acetyltransferase
MNAAIDVLPRRARFPSALIDRITLDDGRAVVMRPVLAQDAEGEQAFVRALSMDSRRNRFHFLLRELPPALLRQMTDVDHVAHVAIVAEAFADDDAPQIVADARYVHDGDETHFAIAVADAWQGVGLGHALMQRLLRHAARHGVARLVADMLAGNTAMARLAASFGARFGASPHGSGLRRALFELGNAA